MLQIHSLILRTAEFQAQFSGQSLNSPCNMAVPLLNITLPVLHFPDDHDRNDFPPFAPEYQTGLLYFFLSLCCTRGHDLLFI